MLKVSDFEKDTKVLALEARGLLTGGGEVSVVFETCPEVDKFHRWWNSTAGIPKKSYISEESVIGLYSDLSRRK